MSRAWSIQVLGYRPCLSLVHLLCGLLDWMTTTTNRHDEEERSDSTGAHARPVLSALVWSTRAGTSAGNDVARPGSGIHRTATVINS